MTNALLSGQVTRYGTDVYPNEPSIPLEFLQDKLRHKVVLLPHIGTETSDTQKAMEELNLRNIECALDQGRVLNPVPEQRNVKVSSSG